MSFIEYSMVTASRHSALTIPSYQIREILSIFVYDWLAVDISLAVKKTINLKTIQSTVFVDWKNYQFKSLQTGGSRNGPSHILSIPVQSSCGCNNILASSIKPNFGAKSNFNIEIQTLKRFGWWNVLPRLGIWIWSIERYFSSVPWNVSLKRFSISNQQRNSFNSIN